MENLRLFDLCAKAWKASSSLSISWLFGGVAGLALLAQSQLTLPLRDILSNGLMASWFSHLDREAVFAAIPWVILCLVMELFGKSNLIVSLSPLASGRPAASDNFTLVATFRTFLRALFLELVIIAALLAVIAILFTPVGIALWKNPTAIGSLVGLASITLIPFAVFAAFVREYGLIYLLLAKLSPRDALYSGASLFSRFALLSIFFGFFSLLITIVFTFCLNLSILSIDALFGRLSGESHVFSLVAAFILLTWFFIFRQALWILFFKEIAAPKNKDADTEEKVFADKIPESPPA